jgi:mersacidin/lichenicidin family type 2 lantibiotic
MSTRNIIRAWKDPVFRNGLNETERAGLPANPAGSIEISDEDLGKVAGGKANFITNTIFDCSFTCSFTCSAVVCMLR